MKLLIAYDGSEASTDALKDLPRAGLPEQTEVRLITVADVFLPPPDANTAEDRYSGRTPPVVLRSRQRAEAVLEAARQSAEQAAKQLREWFPHWRVRFEAVADSPAWTLIREADEWEPDLLIMGARGESDWGGRLILGSVSQRVLYEAHCSVRIAREPRSHDPSVRIVVGLDHSAGCVAALAAVAKRNWPVGTEVRLVSVVDEDTELDPELVAAPLPWREVEAEPGHDRLREIFARAAELVNRDGLQVSVALRTGDPKQILVEEADSWDADAIFVGAKGVRGIERLLLGSVSSSIAARAHCSVEVVRPV